MLSHSYGPGRAVYVAMGVLCAIATFSLPALTNPARTLAVFGYYVDSDPNSLSTVHAQGQRLDGIITTNFIVAESSGRIEGHHDSKILDLARSRGAKVYARVSNFASDRWNRDVVHAILVEPEARARAKADILHLLDRYGYDGVDLAFQNVAPIDRRALTSFVADLGTVVRARGKTLSIAVPPKLVDHHNEEWYGAFDLAGLGRGADRVIVMAFDQHWAASGHGPVASLSWVEGAIQFARRHVPARKLLLGVALYGYEWPAEGPGQGISMREAVSRAQKSGATVLWDEQHQVPYYRTERTTVYFENTQSVELKLGLAARYHLAGVAVWRLGHELPDMWEAVGGYLRSSLRADRPAAPGPKSASRHSASVSASSAFSSRSILR